MSGQGKEFGIFDIIRNKAIQTPNCVKQQTVFITWHSSLVGSQRVCNAKQKKDLPVEPSLKIYFLPLPISARTGCSGSNFPTARLCCLFLRKTRSYYVAQAAL